MHNRRMEFFIGMMVIGIIAGVFVMTLLFHSENGFFVGGNSGRRMDIEFKNGGGISQNSLVLKNGIKIGRVYSVVLLDDMEDSRVRVSFELEPEANIYSNEIAKINRTFLGDASIEIVDNPDYNPETDGEVVALEPGASLKSMKTVDLMGTVTNIEGDLGAALQNVNEATAGVTLFMKNLNTFLGDENELRQKKERLQNVFNELNETLVSIRGLATHMDEVVSDEKLKSDIQEAAERIPSIMKRVDEIAGKADQFMDNATSVSGDVRQTLDRAQTTFDLVDKNLDNIDVFTTSLAENGPEMMTALNEGSVEIKGAIDQVKGAIENIASFVDNVNQQLTDHDSPIGMLTDKEVGSDIRKIVQNTEELTEKLYPIFDDARVFSNKIAHKPSSLLWDKTTTKGGSLSNKFGWQTKSPCGGVTSPLYRQTPAGSKIRSRNYYEPQADLDVMDTKTRAIYESEVLARETARDMNAANAYGDCVGADYSRVVPESDLNVQSRFGFGSGIGDRIKMRTNRVRWSLDSFLSKFSPKKRAIQGVEAADFVDYGDGGVVGAVGYGAYPNANGGYVDQAGYVQYADGGYPMDGGFVADGYSLDGYFDGGNFGGAQVGLMGNEGFVSNGECGVPSCEAPGCGVPSCETPGCGVPSCETPNCEAPNCAAPGCAGPSCENPTGCYNGGVSGGNVGARTSTGAGYQPNSVGAYHSQEPSQMDLIQDGAEGAEQVEELPSSINRVAAPNVNNGGQDSMSGNAFEDDGLPAQFVPPTRVQ